ncbi:hypothetical protein O181_074115 [Austropuccinia psidii MF-1]|uniref:Integrase catalytic domain-containing protein n=1 Tax=Austropuccinia psidii MF-1 TaxID=1389203 RepID=A0A9Q3ICP6_9BASI|nr:hypothetical protein [Austropuccinia psidii MF-1]
MNFESNAEVNSIPILNNSNYGEWVARITILLRSKDLLDVIISCQVNNRVFIEVVKQFSTDSHLLWKKLEEQYASKKAVNRGRVWMQWIKFAYNGDLQNYIDNSRMLMMALETVNITVPNECHSFSLLGKLTGDPKMHSYVEVLTLNEDLIKDPELVLAKLQEFHNNSSSQEKSSSSPPSALISESAHPYKITYFCSNGKHNPMCTTHSKDQCYAENPHLRPPRRNNKRKNQASAHLSTAQALITGNQDFIKPQELIIDCGATHHMFNSLRCFTSFTKTPEISVSTGDSASTLSSTGIGTIVILCGNQSLHLENSLFVPRLNCNLVSLLALSQKKVVINRENEHFALETDNFGTIKGKITNNLMRVEYSIPENHLTASASNPWHERLGHPGNQAIRRMGLPIINSTCSTCDLNKMHMLPFDKHFEEFVLVKNRMESLHDRKLKTLVSDQGGEFVNAKFKNLAKSDGFVHILSPTETPQHNGFSERANRTIIEKARCLLNGSNLPKRYWSEAMKTATFLSNLIPTPSRNNISPYASWKGLPPRIKRLRVFGCRAIISIPRSQRSWKLGPVGAEGVFLGYENENCAYRILRLSDLKIVIAKHVKFEENVFPLIQGITSTKEAWLVPYNGFITAEEASNDILPPNPLPDVESQDNVSCSLSEGSSRVVDEVHEPSCVAEAVVDSNPINTSRIKVIGPRHPTLIVGDVASRNILPYQRRPKTLVTSISKTSRTYNQAINSLEKDRWLKSISKELASMNQLHVWDVVDLKSDYKLVGTTWVFRIKKDHLNNVVEYKARLCAQGFTQTPGVDFDKTYAPTGRLNSLRCLIAHAASKGLHFHQIDVKSAFLNAPLTEVVYLSIPQGLDIDQRRSCLRLKKAIYGLKQAPLAWYQRLKEWLLKIGFSSCVLDPCVFFRSKDSPTWLYIHVDDIAIFGKDVLTFKDEIAQEFDIKDIGCADLMLGIKITHGIESITLDQSHFTESLLDLYGLSQCKSVATPLEPHVYLQPATSEESEKFCSLGVNYRSAIGSINYLSTATRPDLSHAVSSLSQFLENPGINHWNGFLHVLRYLKGTQDLGLVYTKNDHFGIVGYSDADWGNCRSTRRSVTGFLAQFCGNLVLWKTRKQPSVSISTAEAEYKALCDLVSELLWLRQWCHECDLLVDDSAIPIYEDNQSCINTANGDCNLNNRRMKHVDIQLHFIKETVRSSIVRLIYTPTSSMLADFLTKSVNRPILSRSLLSLRVVGLGVRGDVKNPDQDQVDQQNATPNPTDATPPLLKN